MDPKIYPSFFTHLNIIGQALYLNPNCSIPGSRFEGFNRLKRDPETNNNDKCQAVKVFINRHGQPAFVRLYYRRLDRGKAKGKAESQIGSRLNAHNDPNDRNHHNHPNQSNTGR
jgi:hypothetical protein